MQYPVIEELDAGDLDNLKDVVDDARVGSPLQIEMGGDLFLELRGSRRPAPAS